MRIPMQVQAVDRYSADTVIGGASRGVEPSLFGIKLPKLPLPGPFGDIACSACNMLPPVAADACREVTC